jgi:hypothetical protein
MGGYNYMPTQPSYMHSSYSNNVYQPPQQPQMGQMYPNSYAAYQAPTPSNYMQQSNTAYMNMSQQQMPQNPYGQFNPYKK